MSYFQKFAYAPVRHLPRDKYGSNIRYPISCGNIYAAIIPFGGIVSIPNNDTDTIVRIFFFQKSYIFFRVIRSAVKTVYSRTAVSCATAEPQKLIYDLLRYAKLGKAFAFYCRLFFALYFRRLLLFFFFKIIAIVYESFYELCGGIPSKLYFVSSRRIIALINEKPVFLCVIPYMLCCAGAVKFTVKPHIVYSLYILRFLFITHIRKQKRHDVFLAFVQVVTVS